MERSQKDCPSHSSIAKRTKGEFDAQTDVATHPRFGCCSFGVITKEILAALVGIPAKPDASSNETFIAKRCTYSGKCGLSAIPIDVPT